MSGSNHGAASPRGHVELPPSDTKRWSPRRKAAVVVATRAGARTRTEAWQRYMLSDEELAHWEVAYDTRGVPGLRCADLHLYRGRGGN